MYPPSKTQCLQCVQYYKYWSRLLLNDQKMYVLLVLLFNLPFCLWQFNRLFHKVLMQPFLTWVVGIAAIKEHLVPHPMSGDLFLILNILHSSLAAKLFWNEFPSFFSGVQFLCAHLLTVLLFKEIVKFHDTHESDAIRCDSNLNVLLIVICHVMP